MSNSKKGLRIGNYRITPLGLGALAVIVLIIIAVIAIFVFNPFGGADGVRAKAQPSPSPSVTPVPTAVPTPTPTPAPTPRSATIRSLGEIAIQDNLLEAAKAADGGYDFADMFSYASDVMGGADFTVADVEGSLGGTADASGSSKMLTPPALIQALKDCGVDMLNIANDHALDGGAQDLAAALDNCRSAGMEYVGAAASQAERDSAKIITIQGIKVGFVAYTEGLNGMEKKADGDVLKYGVNLVSKCNAKKDIQACRDAGAEIVVAYMSWGDMLKREVTENQKTLAKALVSAGADVIIGYNPHVIQPATWIEMKDKAGNVTRRTLCLCSAGNFLSDSREKYSDSGVIFQFTIQEKEDFSGLEIVDPVYIPTYVWRVDNEDNTHEYRTLAAGQWLDSAPADPVAMNYTQYSRMKEVYAEAQTIMGADVAKVAAE